MPAWINLGAVPVGQAGIEGGDERILVHVTADDAQARHAVARLVVPNLHDLGVLVDDLLLLALGFGIDLQKFTDFVEQEWPDEVIRVKGPLWQASNPDMCYMFEQAGHQMRLMENGLFVDSAPEGEKRSVSSSSSMGTSPF